MDRAGRSPYDPGVDDLQIRLNDTDRRALILALGISSVITVGVAVVCEAKATGPGLWIMPVICAAAWLWLAATFLNRAYGTAVADADGIELRSPANRRTVAWQAVSGIEIELRVNRGGSCWYASLRLADGGSVKIPGLLCPQAAEERVAAFRATAEQVCVRWQQATGRTEGVLVKA